MKKEFLKNIIKESITDYLSELNSSDHLEEELIDETPTTEGKSPFEDKVTKGDGYIYLVKKALNESTEKDLVEKMLLTDLIGEGLYEGAYLNEAQAMSAAKKVVKAKDALMKENVKKGHEKVGGLEKQVADLKTEMAKLIDNPEMRGELSNYTTKLEKAEQVLEKLKVALKKSAPKKEKKETKDDK
jgi:hypothetical protein